MVQQIKQKQKNLPSSSLIFMFSFTEGDVWCQSQINTGTS